MTTQVEKTITVDAPVRVVYDQWTQFEEFPQFMSGVSEVRQLDDQRLHWIAEIAGVKREWEARILEQVPDQKVAWAATSGATNAGAVTFWPSGDQTEVRLHLEYEPEGLLESIGDKVGFVGRQAESDLERFKSFIESKGEATGGWRGGVDAGNAVGTPGVEHAAASQGDDGKAGVSGKAVAAGVAAAAAGVAAVVAAKKSGGDDSTEVERPDVEGAAPVTSDVSPGAAADVPSSGIGTYEAGADTGLGSGGVATGPATRLGDADLDADLAGATDDDLAATTGDGLRDDLGGETRPSTPSGV